MMPRMNYLAQIGRTKPKVPISTDCSKCGRNTIQVKTARAFSLPKVRWPDPLERIAVVRLLLPLRSSGSPDCAPGTEFLFFPLTITGLSGCFLANPDPDSST